MNLKTGIVCLLIFMLMVWVADPLIVRVLIWLQNLM